MSGQNDPKQLMKLAKMGDKEAFGVLYDCYFVPVFRYVYLRVKNRAEAEDLVQEVFLKIYNSLPSYEERGRPPLAYFFTIARNLIVDSWRKKKADTVDLENLEIRDLRPLPLEMLQQQESAEAVRQLLKELPPDQQEVLVLKFVNEQSNQEIAALLEKSEEAVRQIQSRALKALRKNVTDVLSSP